MPVQPEPPKPPGKGSSKVEKQLYQLELRIYELQLAVQNLTEK